MNNITDIPIEILGLHLSRTVKSKLVQTSAHFNVLRQPLERHFAFSHPTFIRLYINLLDNVKTKFMPDVLVNKAKSDYSKGVRNVTILNTLILHYLKKQSGNFIFKIYELYKDHLTLLHESDGNEVKIQKVFSIIYEFAKLYLMIHFVNNKSVKRAEYTECIAVVVSGIAQKLEDSTPNSTKYFYFQKINIVINYIQYYNKDTKVERLYKYIKDLYGKIRTSNRVINLEKNSDKENYDACVAFLLDHSNHKYF